MDALFALVRKDMYAKQKKVPSKLWSFKDQAENKSMVNTPPTFGDKCTLILAEIARLEKRDADAMHLAATLAGFAAWGSGVRRDESPTRAGTRLVDWDAKRGMVKVNPIAAWTQDDVDAYIERHQVPVNPLFELGYGSIGCAPCTRPVQPGEDPRAGRWAGRGKTECGIHT